MKLNDLAKDDGLIITPIHRRWIATHGSNPPLSKDAKALLRQELLSSGKRMAGPRLFRASDAGACQRKRMMHRLGFEATRKPPLQNLAIMRSGIWAHARWQADGLSAGWLRPGSPEFPLYDPSGRYRMKLDGILTEGGFNFELKTAKPGAGSYSYDMVKASNKPLRSHALQALYGAEALGVEKAVVLYENRADMQFLEFHVERTAATVQAVNDDLGPLVEQLEGEKMPPVLPACVEKRGMDYNMCDFRDSCPMAEKMAEGKWEKAKNVTVPAPLPIPGVG